MTFKRFSIFFILSSFLFTECDKIDIYWDLNKLPEVKTNFVGTILDISAAVGGDVINDGGTTIFERGVCYSQNKNPNTSDSLIKCGNGKGKFYTVIAGLKPKTNYYLKAYAKNKLGTAYGTELSFSTKGVPSIYTIYVTSITASTALSGGDITSDGGSAITEKGICWGTSINPTIANNKTINGSGSNSFTSNITGLIAKATYFVRAYATNSFGTEYGDNVSFSTTATASLPKITTTSISIITSVSGQSGGNITDDGGAIVNNRGVCWSTLSNPTTTDSKTSEGSGSGIFISSINGLNVYTRYYVRAYATNSVGTAYGNQLYFTTSAGLPTVITSSISNVTSSTATGGGTVSSTGGSSVTARGICYYTAPNPTITNSRVVSGSGTGTFTSSITGLVSNRTYYVRAYATNSLGTAYGSEVNFSTSAFSVGMSYGGGKIFYIDATGQHGFISATTNQTSSTWGCSGKLLTGCSGTVIGTGQSNTTAIVNGCTTTGIAARFCNDLVLNAYIDWYLPSKDELNLMYQQRTIIGGFSATSYWSSSQATDTTAVILSFSSGLKANGAKTSTYYVRAIRSF